MSPDTTPPMGRGAAAHSAGDAGTTPTEVVRSEERLRPGVERLVTGSVRIGKRVVTEERTVTVTVRREELVLEHGPAAAAADGGAAPDRSPTEPVVTLTLSEEVPEVTVRVVPRERVRLYVDRLTTGRPVTAELAREVVEHEVLGRDGDAASPLGG